MITIQDIKDEFHIEATDTTQDVYYQKVIDRTQASIKRYCKNEDIDFSVELALDDVVLYLCVRAINPDTRLRAGKTNENIGASFAFADDLPTDLKRILKSYRKVSFL
jgi:hypothetical protein